MNRRWKRFVSMGGALAVLTAMLSIASTPASATGGLRPGIDSGNGVTPTVVEGFPDCSTGTQYTWDGTRTGTQEPEPGVSITVSSSDGPLPGRDSRYFDFDISGAVMVETVVFSNFLWYGYLYDGSNVYSYDPADLVAADTNLHAPTLFWNSPNKRDGMRFCYDAVSADLSIEKSVDQESPDNGDTVTYTLEVTNTSSSGTTATGVTVTDELPDGVTFVSASDGGTEVGGTVSWSDLSIEPGTTLPLTVTATVDGGAPGGVPLVNTAEVVPGDQPDPDLDNNVATATATVNQAVDMSIDKSVDDDDDVVGEGDPLEYSLLVANSAGSNATATGVTVKDTLPAGVTVTSLPAECSRDDRDITCSVDDLVPGAAGTITIGVTVDVGTEDSTLTNTAAVSANENDPDPENNESSADVEVLPVLTCEDILEGLGSGETIIDVEVQIFGDQFLAEIGAADYPTLTGVTDPGTGNPSISCKVGEDQAATGLQTTVAYGEFDDPWYR